jgi:ABC-type sugar transport system substrate-binding protein
VVFLSLDISSKGSRDAIKAAKKAGVPVFIFDKAGNPVVPRIREQLALF